MRMGNRMDDYVFAEDIRNTNIRKWMWPFSKDTPDQGFFWGSKQMVRQKYIKKLVIITEFFWKFQWIAGSYNTPATDVAKSME